MLSTEALKTHVKQVETEALIELHPVLCLNAPYRNLCEAAAALKHQSFGLQISSLAFFFFKQLIVDVY